MTSSDMDQIRELLVGEFEAETKNEFKAIKNRILELKEENKREVEALSKSLKLEIEQISKFLEDRYSYLEESVNSKFNSQKNITENEFRAIKKEIIIQKEFTSKSFEAIKSTFEGRLRDLRNESIQKNVSKESLASAFFEYALKLKNENIGEQLKNKIKLNKETK